MSGTRAKEEEEAKARTQEWARRRAEGEAMVREAALKASGVAPSGAPEGTQNAPRKDQETAATTHDAGGGEGAAKADPASQPETSEASAPAEEPVKPRRFVGRKRAEQDGKAEGGGSGSLVRTAARSQPRVVHTIPDDILNNEALNEEIAANLPANYNFEVHKTVWRLREAKCKTVALQLPEGLQMFACPLADILGRFAEVEVVVLGDVTYGACCVDDLTGRALGADFLVHYGHSCLVPVDSCTLPVLYIFVAIAFDTAHLEASVKHAFPATHRLLLVSTVQFVDSLHKVRQSLEGHFAGIVVPQSRPLSKGEVLGCTAPQVDAANIDAVLYIGDGRFHLEAIMIANPSLAFFRYDPYSKLLSSEAYAYDQMYFNRKAAIAEAADAASFCVVLGTLGRQGNPHILQRMLHLIRNAGRRSLTVLMSELSPGRLALLSGVDAFVQVACPRLSIDWGHAFHKPVLNPYELEVALNQTPWRHVYPMDYYAKEAGPWANLPNNPPKAPLSKAPAPAPSPQPLAASPPPTPHRRE